ncbi:hypothetical protein V1504DRAFT_449903, partial [Lipomyces starkeyi]
MSYVFKLVCHIVFWYYVIGWISVESKMIFGLDSFTFGRSSLVVNRSPPAAVRHSRPNDGPVAKGFCNPRREEYVAYCYMEHSRMITS